MSVKNEEIINVISKMNVLELVELIKDIEKKFGLSAQLVSTKSDNLASSELSSQKEVKTEEENLFTVIMTSYGDDKVNIIKKIRTILNLGLKESKDFVENLPATIKKGILKNEADLIKKDLETAGAKVELR